GNRIVDRARVAAPEPQPQRRRRARLAQARVVRPARESGVELGEGGFVVLLHPEEMRAPQRTGEIVRQPGEQIGAGARDLVPVAREFRQRLEPRDARRRIVLALAERLARLLQRVAAAAGRDERVQMLRLAALVELGGPRVELETLLSIAEAGVKLGGAGG